MTEQLDNLEAQLLEKEQLVAALTERLEQAAEQLDRFRRTGADRALRVGGGFPPELVEEQRQLVTELQQAVQHWEDMQPGVLLGRLEIQLTELRDLVASRGGYGGIAEHGRAHDHSASQHRGTQPAGRDDEQDSETPGGGPSGYEAMKASMLAAEKPSEESHAPPEKAPAVSVPDYEAPPLADPPSAIDVPNASIEDLRTGVEERDSYILLLLERLRNAELRHYVPQEWAAVEGVPTELRVRLEVLEKHLEEALRTAEVELSLQRAKLGREEARIRLLDEQVQKELKRAVSNSDDGGSTDTEGRSTGGRLMRMLGKRKGDR